MEILISIIKYLFTLIINFVLSILNIIPFGFLLSFFEVSNNQITNYLISFLYNNNVLIFILFIFIILNLFGFVVVFLLLKFFIKGLYDLLFREKYKQQYDDNISVLKDNLIHNEIKYTISNVKGFIGELIDRIHKYKLGINLEKIHFFGFISLLVAYLIGIFNSKELKKINFLRNLIFFVGISLFIFLLFKPINIYYPVIYNTNTKPYIDLNSDMALNVNKKNINFPIKSVGDYEMFLFSIFGVKTIFTNDNANINTVNNDYLVNLFDKYIDKVKAKYVNNELSKEEYNKLPLYIKHYLQNLDNNVPKDYIISYYNDLPFLFKIFHLLYIYKLVEKDTNPINNFIISLYLNTYSWNSIIELNKKYNESQGLLTMQKIIYALNLLPLYHKDIFIPVNKFNSLIGEVNIYTEKDVKTNVDNVYNNQNNNQNSINNIKDLPEKIKNQTVINPKYVLRVMGIFPVIFVSTSKIVNILYFLFLIGISLIWFILIILFAGVGRFAYIFLLRNVLDDKQKENFNIEWNVEFFDTAIRLLMFFIIYYFIISIFTTRLF